MYGPSIYDINVEGEGIYKYCDNLQIVVDEAERGWL